MREALLVPTAREAAPDRDDARHRGAAPPGPTEHQALLLEVTRAILEQDRDEAGLARMVFDLVAPHIDADIGFNYAVEADGLTLRLVAGPGIPETILPLCQRLRVGQALCGATAANRVPLLADAARIAEETLAALPRAMGIRAYVGHPLLDRRGGLLGTLAFASTRRDRFSPGEIGLLRTLSDFVALTWQRHRAEAALRASEERLHSVIGTAADGIIVASAEGRILLANPAVLRMFGHAEAELIGRNIGILMPPEDAARHLDHLAARRRGGPARAIDVPGRELLARRRDGSTFPVEISVGSFGVGGECFLTGILRDVTERRRAEERQELLMREVNHRARNALAVVQATLRLTPKEDAATFARAVEGRVAALARAQGLLTREHWRGAELRALLQGELAAFIACEAGTAAGGGTDRPPPVARLEGPLVWLPATATQPLAMAVHELATNAVKHGALSLPGGEVTVRWHLAGDDDGRSVLHLRWVEAGGPAVAAPPTRRGFGSRVLEATLRGQLGGTVSLDWAAAGLACAIEVPLGRAA